jgi:hypothetical protein
LLFWLIALGKMPEVIDGVIVQPNDVAEKAFPLIVKSVVVQVVISDQRESGR